MQNALKNIIQKSDCCFRTFLLCHYKALGVYPENFSSCENVYVLELQNLSTSVGKEKMLESRTQPELLQEKHQEIFGSLGRDTVSCCGWEHGQQLPILLSAAELSN